jgi:hypothetical protein
MVELLQLKVTSQTPNATSVNCLDRASSDLDNKTDDEEEKSAAQVDENLSPSERLMNDTLNAKRQEVVVSLIENLSAKNKNDLEASLNAHLILTELTESEITFLKLVQKDNFLRLIQAACDIQNVN